MGYFVLAWSYQASPRFKLRTMISGEDCHFIYCLLELMCRNKSHRENKYIIWRKLLLFVHYLQVSQKWRENLSFHSWKSCRDLGNCYYQLELTDNHFASQLSVHCPSQLSSNIKYFSIWKNVDKIQRML